MHGPSTDPEDARKRYAQQLLREFGDLARLVVYVAAAPGAGKTRRLLTDAKRLAAVGKNVMIGWVETKGRPDLERLASEIPSIPPRIAQVGDRHFPEFDLEAALRAKPDVIVLDELAHDNLPGSINAKRWQDALALRDAGITVLGSFNIAHLETVAPTAEALIGFPVREIIPLSFLKSADEVIALDVSPEQLRARVKSGKIVRDDDIERALNGAFKQTTLFMLRELLLRTIDDLTIPTVSAAATSSAVAIVLPDIDPINFLKRSAAVAAAFDLALEIIPSPQVDRGTLEQAARDVNAELMPPQDPVKVVIGELRASMVAVSASKLAAKMVNTRVERDIFVVGQGQTYLAESSFSTPLSGTFGDRMRRGYGKLTVYLGAAAGSGKTMAMLDRGHQLKADGVDVVVGFVETHGRAETEALVEGLDVLPRKTVAADGITYTEFDREALLKRKPQVALIDELAHTNAPGSIAPKRYLDVLAILRAGIDVMTTLNVQHLEALSEAVYRLTGKTIRETLPDGILPLADEIILIDVTPETLRDRLRAGKIYPAERIETALANFFRTDNLAALRELAIREALRAETRERIVAPFDRLLLSVVARKGDIPLIRRAGRLAARLEVDFTLCHVAEPRDKVDPEALAEIERIARAINAEWIDEKAPNAAVRLIEIARARHETTVAVGGTLRTPRWPQPNSFARRMLDAGARDLIVLARPATESPAVSDEG
jgi:two-component system sensor histidine kinase KdpD